MQLVQLLFLLSCWYAPGFLAARAMTKRGQDPLPWIYAAWIGGALAAVAAVVWVRFGPAPDPMTTLVDRQPVTSGPAPDPRNP